MEDSTYEMVFLIEDDYIPNEDHFLTYFVNLVQPSTGFVAQVAQAIPGVAPYHASVSNGLLLMEAARTSYRLLGSSMIIYPHQLDRAGYVMGTENQVLFLSGIETCGFSIRDVSKICAVPFYETTTGQILNRGLLGAPAPLVPWDLQ
jgi:hypothetical protein